MADRKTTDDVLDLMAALRESLSKPLPDGVPCKHRGCLSHISHPCEGCGRINGRSSHPATNKEP